MFGQHVIGSISVQNKDLLTSEKVLEKKIALFCQKANLTVVSKAYYLFNNPKAITYCFVLSQSHLVVHTWPEYDSLTFDLFTCAKIQSVSECIRKLADVTAGTVSKIETVDL